MKQITCEICGGKNIIKRDGAYVCADCGIKYTADEIKKLLSNTPDDVPACSEMPLENSESAPSNSTAGRENPDKTNHKSKIPLVAVMACVCIALLVVVFKIVIPNVRYNNAVSLMNDGKYEEAIAAFEAMDGYNDSAEQIIACETQIKDEAYDAAVALMDKGKYEEAIKAFEAMDGYKDSANKIGECNYSLALSLMSKGNVVEAYERLIAIDGYKDSAEKAEGIRFEYETEKMKCAEVGDYIYFGTYEQDNNKSNGKENIDWQVLAKEDNRILVISKYVLDSKPYNTEWKNVTWETCTLRTWLNGTFLNEAFTEAEQTLIQTAKVSADKNPDYSAYPGNATMDKIFLLSINEANEYFASDEARMCATTSYAKAIGVWTYPGYTVDGEDAGLWWLRSPGFDQDFAAEVVLAGGVNSDGNYVILSEDGVRPAMWIDLSA